MKKTFELFRLDWRRILKSPIAFLLILALIIIPSLYAWFNIWALWDPYSKTQDLKVAVYSADQSVTVAKKKVAIGDELIDQLKKNDKLGWQFTSSKKQLDEGVITGKYYGGSYVPKNFNNLRLLIHPMTRLTPLLVYVVVRARQRFNQPFQRNLSRRLLKPSCPLSIRLALNSMKICPSLTVSQV